MVISGCNESYKAKKYYALSSRFVFLIEKDGKMHTDILKDNKVSFIIDKDKPDFFFQGTGRVEIFGEPNDFHIEHGTLLYKISQDALFIKSGHVHIARLDSLGYVGHRYEK